MYHVTYISKEYLDLRDIFIEWPSLCSRFLFMLQDIYI